MPPQATYRLQFNAGFTFADAHAIVAYLADLGISHVYASSYLTAAPGSTHGYDVTDPTRLDPELGPTDEYARWVAALRARGMAHILDVVPNHMGIAGSANAWWQDVLENGESSLYANVFDIDWHPLKLELEDKVLLPVLADAYGAVLERQELRLVYADGAFTIRYVDRIFPIGPGTYRLVLGDGAQALIEALGPDHADALEYQSILTAIEHLPTRQALSDPSRRERHREKEIIKRRLAALTGSSPHVLGHLDATLRAFNGHPGDSRSFDRLDALLDAQAYRLAYWQVASEEINYRRFFDINDLAAIRVEDPEVFERTHAFIFERIASGDVDGLRIDHVDGLFDPGDYLARLRRRASEIRADLREPSAPLYVVVEKVLGFDERLPAWPVDGTTGYDFLAMVNGLFVEARNGRALTELYQRFTRAREPFREIAQHSKQRVLRVSMSSELNVLAHRLNRLSEHSRHFRDFTLNSLTRTLRDIIACFPVYRTYVTGREPEVSARDRAYIEQAVGEAQRRTPERPAAVSRFVRDLLLDEHDALVGVDRAEQLQFVGRFQQLTSPVTAKGVEDTALYIYNRLTSLNEVGSEPDVFGIEPDRLHAWFAARVRDWPHALSTTSTHDTKRSEDVRARINVLSELPGAWKQAIGRWTRLNRRAESRVDSAATPTRNEQYLFYQTLVGSWPLAPMSPAQEADYTDRIAAYMRKAVREAKVHTSWIAPSDAHEAAIDRFVRRVLASQNTGFRQDFTAFAERIARHGIYNALAQLTIKITAPGVPDLYQGTELWTLTLVDPDNRRPVDYARRAALLSDLDASERSEGRAALAARLASALPDDRAKLFATATLLRLRRTHAALFTDGAYLPLASSGTRRDRVFAFARHAPGEEALIAPHVLVLTPRLVATLTPDASVPPTGTRTWDETAVTLPSGAPDTYWHALTGTRVPVLRESGSAWVRLADAFESWPIAVLIPDRPARPHRQAAGA